MRAFLTGATGTVGREVYRALRGRGVEVRIAARRSRALADTLAGASDVVVFEFEAPSISPTRFEGVDAFFFMTPLIETQVSASLRVLNAAIEAGVHHIVRLSSRAAGWDERSKLRNWQREVDDAVTESEAGWTILRPCSLFQNFIHDQAEAIRTMSSIIVPQGDGLIPYVDALDIGDAAAECLMYPVEHQGKTHVLTGSRAYGAKGVAAEIGRMIQKPLTYIDLEEAQSRDMMLQAGMPPWLVEARLAVFAHAKAGGEAAVDPALSRIIGRPATSLSDFVDRNRDAWQ
ncbi:MAG: NAD(P)H-binding protein [Myxococcales bacterium]|nr:NAD(P)H-binding protein [Myxococcales bacterium]